MNTKEQKQWKKFKTIKVNIEAQEKLKNFSWQQSKNNG